MVETLQPYSDALKKLQVEIPTILKKILLNRSDEIIKLIYKKQLSKGKDGDGKIIGTYARATELISLFESPKPIKPKKEDEPYNFEWTGKWKKGLEAILINENYYDILSIDGKHKELIKQYGEKLTKLNEKDNIIVNETMLKPDLYQVFVDRLTIGI